MIENLCVFDKDRYKAIQDEMDEITRDLFPEMVTRFDEIDTSEKVAAESARELKEQEKEEERAAERIEKIVVDRLLAKRRWWRK